MNVAVRTDTVDLPERPDVVIAGGGIGGLTLALALHERGIGCVVYEMAREIRPLGVGINLLPHAVRVLTQLRLDRQLAAHSVATKELAYFNRHGQLIWSEPRGRDAGYDYPQFSVHRGVLQTELLATVRQRLGSGVVRTGLAVAGFTQDNDQVSVRLTCGRRGRDAGEVRTQVLIGADGVHSTVRSQLHPDEGGLRYSGRMLWRAVTRGQGFMSRRSMIMAGHQDQKFVCYPITPADPQGLQTINWIAELPVPGTAPPPQDWSRVVQAGVFRSAFADWRFEWLDVPALIDGAEAIYEYPLSDRDPLDSWGDGRVNLLGDAAHPMYPIGSNGASQAILDAESLANALADITDPAAALAAYEEARRPATSAIVRLNRQNGPEQVMQLAEQRAPDGFANIHDVIQADELEEIAARYKLAAGFAPEQVNRQT